MKDMFVNKAVLACLSKAKPTKILHFILMLGNYADSGAAYFPKDGPRRVGSDEVQVVEAKRSHPTNILQEVLLVKLVYRRSQVVWVEILT